MTGRLLLAAAALVAGVSGAGAQALDQKPTKPIGELLAGGFTIAATSTNARPGEVVVILRKDAEHFACTLTEFRGAGYSDPKAKPAVTPCVPLN